MTGSPHGQEGHSFLPTGGKPEKVRWPTLSLPEILKKFNVAEWGIVGTGWRFDPKI